MKKIIVVLFLSVIFSGILQAQDQAPRQSNIAPSWSVPELITDRPDQTESSCTVPKNSLQVETGFIYENYDLGGVKLYNWGFATTLLRYGVWDNFELRLGSYFQLSNIKSDFYKTDSTQSGIGPILVGFKVYVVEEKGVRPEISIMADLTLNKVGNLDYRPAYTYSSIKILASHTLSNFFSLGYNLGFASDGETASGLFVYSVVLGMNVSEKFGAFAEIYGTSAEGDSPNHRIDGGLTYLVRHNLQLDISGGTGLDGGIKMYFVNFGLTWRIPK